MLISLFTLSGLLPLLTSILAEQTDHANPEASRLEETDSNVKVNNSCSFSRFLSMSEEITGYQAESLSKYDLILSKLDSCIDNLVPSDENLIDLKELRNQLLYKAGLIQLSIGNDLRAINTFEQIENLNDSLYNHHYYYNLSRSRLSSLYVEFGFWEKLEQLDPQNEELDLFRYLNRTLFEKLQDIKLENLNLSELQDELTTMLNIAPYDLDILSIKVDYLFERLINEKGFNDPTLAYEIIKIYDTVLEKFKSSSLNISQRIRMYRSIAILQLLVLNSDPSHHLRKCLTLDMDDKLCKKMSLLVSRLNKINPPRRLLLDPESYANGNGIDIKDLSKIYQYYLQVKQGQNGEFSNYESILQQLTDLVLKNKELFLSKRPLLSHQLPLSNDIHLDTIHNFEFPRYIDIILCQVNIEQSLLTRGNSNKKKKEEFKQNVKQYCKRTLKSLLNEEQLDNLKRALKDKDTVLSDGLLEAIWNSYPTIAMYLIDTLVSSKNFKNSVKLQQQLQHFIKNENLSNSKNRYIRKLVTHVQKVASRKRVEGDKIKFQKFQQQRQWNFQRGFEQNFGNFQFRNFKQDGSRSQQNYQPPPAAVANKDYYKVLGVPSDASSKDIRKAYLNLTKKYHPDKQGQLSEEEKKKVHGKMAEINEAYEILSDENKKNDYDRARTGGGVNFNFHQQQGNPFPFQ